MSRNLNDLSALTLGFVMPHQWPQRHSVSSLATHLRWEIVVVIACHPDPFAAALECSNRG
jgi:hypothetical protein